MQGMYKVLDWLIDNEYRDLSAAGRSTPDLFIILLSFPVR